jgi:hypothetical protein
MTALADWKRALMALYPPGSFSRDPSSLHGVLAEADAKVLYAGAQVVEQLEKEVFPQTAEQDLSDWESIYRMPHAPGATDAMRRAALTGRWRGGMPFNLAGVRAIVAELISPEYAWRDAFGNALIDWRYRQILNACTLVETVGAQDLHVAAATDARWDATHKLGATSLIDLIVEDGRITLDDFWFSAKITACSSNDGLLGVCLHQDLTNSQWWGLWTIGADVKLRKSWICDNVIGGPANATVEPAYPYWLTIGRVAGETRVYLDAVMPSPFNPASLTLKGSLAVPFHPRQVGVVLWNDGATSQNITVGEVRLAYRMKHHNVEIIENCLATLSGATDLNRFFCFVRRSPLDAGAADLRRATLELDRFKPGHINLTVGESTLFITDSFHDLTDRDVLGS